MKYILHAILIILIFSEKNYSQVKGVLLKNVTLIDGTGKPAQPNVSILVKDGKIQSISKQNNAGNTKVIDLAGKTIMPLLTNVHGHLGMIKGTTVSSENYTRKNIKKELERYQSYGVGTIVSMGTDRELIFSLRDSSRAGKLPGACVYTAGYGFRPPLGERPPETGMEKIYRPATPKEAVDAMQELAKLKPDLVKMWIDDMGGTVEKIKPEVYRAIVNEAHKNAIRVAAHLYYLEDAHLLLDAGVDIFAHSIRDKEVDDVLIAKMKAKGTIYIPTLTRDGYEFFYETTPAWINDPFFKASLEPGVYEMITSPAYQKKVRNSAQYQRNKASYAMALRNLKKLFDAGVIVALGTDSGALPVRAQGFSEHLELQLMVEAGLTPLQAIAVATRNSAQALKIKDQGTLAPGMNADFIVLDEDPSDDIKATRTIHAVWKNGIQVSNGPALAK